MSKMTESMEEPNDKSKYCFEAVKVRKVFENVEIPLKIKEREKLFQCWKLNLVCISYKKLFFCIDNEVYVVPLYPGLPFNGQIQKLPYKHVSHKSNHSS
jgi:hypothetical protein